MFVEMTFQMKVRRTIFPNGFAGDKGIPVVLVSGKYRIKIEV